MQDNIYNIPEIYKCYGNYVDLNFFSSQATNHVIYVTMQHSDVEGNLKQYTCMSI